MSEDKIATVQDLINYLESNFKPDDMLCFFDEGGAWCELVHVPDDFIGDKSWMFNYVGDKMKHELDIERNAHVKRIIVDDYRLVSDKDVCVL